MKIFKNDGKRLKGNMRKAQRVKPIGLLEVFL